MTTAIHDHLGQTMVAQDGGDAWHVAEYHKLTDQARTALDHLCENGESTIEDLAAHIGVSPGHAGRLLHDAIEGHLVKEQITDDGKVLLSARHLITNIHASATGEPQALPALKAQFMAGVRRYVTVRSGAIVLAYLSQIFLARWLGVQDYGYYSMATTIAILLSMMGSMGFPMSMGRFMPQYLGEKDPGHFKGLLSYATRMSLLTSILLCALAFPFITYTGMASAEIRVMWLALVLVPLLALGDLIGPALRSQSLWLESFLPKMLLAPALLLGFAWLLHQRAGELTAAHMTLALILASVVSVGLEWALNKIKESKEIKQAKEKEEEKPWMHASLPMLAMMLFGVIVNRADLILIGIIAGHHEAGIYAVVLFTAELVALFKDAAKTVVTSIIAPLFHKKDYDSIQALGAYLSRMAFGFTLAGAALIAFFGHQLLAIFGSEFTAGYQALLILLVMQLLRSASGIPGLLLIMTGKQTQLVKVYSLSVVVQVALLAILVPRFGIVGAAIATTITEMVSIYTISLTARKTTGLSSSLLASQSSK